MAARDWTKGGSFSVLSKEFMIWTLRSSVSLDLGYVSLFLNVQIRDGENDRHPLLLLGESIYFNINLNHFHDRSIEGVRAGVEHAMGGATLRSMANSVDLLRKAGTIGVSLTSPTSIKAKCLPVLMSLRGHRLGMKFLLAIAYYQMSSDIGYILEETPYANIFGPRTTLDLLFEIRREEEETNGAAADDLESGEPSRTEQSRIRRMALESVKLFREAHGGTL